MDDKIFLVSHTFKVIAARMEWERERRVSASFPLDEMVAVITNTHPLLRKPR